MINDYFCGTYPIQLNVSLNPTIMNILKKRDDVSICLHDA